jgi:hypothetical protein
VAKPKHPRPPRERYAVIVASSSGGWCEMLSYARWEVALETVATARRGGWNAHLVRATVAGVPREEIRRLGLRHC